MNSKGRFCEDCGGQAVSETAKFCPKCGVALPAVPRAPERETPPTPSSKALNPNLSAYQLSGWSKWLTIAVGLWSFAAFAVGATALQIASLVNDPSVSSYRRFPQLISQSETASGGYALAAIASLVLLACWSWRVTKNAHNWGSPKRSPGWAAGSWFCPIANFWVPYANLKEVWEITETAAPDASTKEPPLLLGFAGYWGSVIIGAFLQEEPSSLSQVSNQLNLAGLAAFGQAVSLIFIIISIRAISARQDNVSAV